MITHELRSELDAIERDPALREEANFGARAEAIDHIEFDVIDRIDGLLRRADPPPELIPLKRHAEGLKRRLEDIDDRLFRRLRSIIRAGDCTGTALARLIDEHVGPDPDGGRRRDEPGYDRLDAFINGLLLIRPVPAETKAREPEMVAYQPTPARIILELVEKARLTREDVFYDLGSGPGQVAILVHLLSGATARGIEVEPAYCDYARACAADLGLSRVEFVNVDARKADYAEGTAFFMYTPFVGAMLREVLEKLRRESRTRTIRLFTYGPCTPQVSRQRWLKRVPPREGGIYELGAFIASP